MITRKLWNGSDIPALGLGCWAIGGPFYMGGASKGWGVVDDAVSLEALETAAGLGIRFFDTAQAYGAGHSEALLGRAFAKRHDIFIGTKVGYAIDPSTKELIGEDVSPVAIEASIEASLKRLKRERIDLVHLHTNELPIAEAEPVFQCLERLRAAGKIDAFGWSTDHPDRAVAFAHLPGYVSVQHAMNVFFRAGAMVPAIERYGLLSMNRSPLAMGLLSGKYDGASSFAPDDVRGQNDPWMDYFKDGKVEPSFALRLSAVRDLLQSDGRKLVQGAICWLWARSGIALPIPGFRNASQVDDLAGALAFGPLPDAVMDEIERVIAREPEGPPRAR